MNRKEKILLYSVGGLVGLVLLANLLFGLLFAEPERMDDVACIVALRRISTALVDYALKNDGKFPESLDELDQNFGSAPLILRCPITGVEFTYLPIIGLDSPPEVPFLFCGAEHGSERTRVDGRSCLVVLSQMQVIRQCGFEPSLLLMLIKPYQDALQKPPDDRLLALRDIVSDTRAPLWLRRLALWRIGEERRSDAAPLIEPFLKNRLLAFDAAIALAKSDSNAGAEELLKALSSTKYRRRWRALHALIHLTKDDFGYSPELSPEQNEDALKGWKEWLKKAND